MTLASAIRPRGVVADPVAFGAGARGEGAARRVGELGAEDEERRPDAGTRQRLQHARRRVGLGPVVEAEGDLH
jgi:hypothetical protein